MNFKFIVSDTTSIYAVTHSGKLFWYGDTKKDGTNGPYGESGWDPHSGTQIGVGWDEFVEVLAGGDGVIYAIKPSGELLYYRDLKQDGTNGAHGESGWDSRSGSQIGVGWDEFVRVFSGGGSDFIGIPLPLSPKSWIYGIKPGGELTFYVERKRDGMNGSGGESGWEPLSGMQIGTGWSDFVHVIGYGGHIYAVTTAGALIWYYREPITADPVTGTPGWRAGSGSQIGSGWDQFAYLFAGPYKGMIYAVRPSGELLYYRHLKQDGTNGPNGESGWAAGSGSQIGIGW
jgi:N,N-dimethylformamidase